MKLTYNPEKNSLRTIAVENLIPLNVQNNI